MLLDKENEKKLLHILLNIGEAMLCSGAEVNRVEDTLSRIGIAYGALSVNVFVITSSIVVTILYPDERYLTETRRIRSNSGTDFSLLETLNSISRRCCNVLMPVSELDKEVFSAVSKVSNRKTQYWGSILAAGGFTLFFGGTLADSVCASLFAVIVCFFQEKLSYYCPNKVAFNIIASFLIGTGISITGLFLPILNPDMIMIGNIMLLIPGIAMTNSIRDILVGDTISGIMRLIESILWAGSLACGFMFSIYITGGLL